MRFPGQSVRRFAIVCCAVLIAYAALGQQAPAPDPTKLALNAASLPTGSPRHLYKFQFQAHGGIPPMKYAVTEGSLPTGMRIGEDGLLSGTPQSIGKYRFTVAVTDSSTPPQKATRAFELRIVQPMLMAWKKYAHVTGNRVDGSVVISNSTEDDFDFTLVVLAVADNGRATAIGYQHFALKSGVESLEIPFSENLPKGNYIVHVDAVAEVPAKDQIYRTRLQTKGKLPVTIGP